MDKIVCMHAYCEVVREGGFSAAARKIGSSKVLVSRYVSALETDLGVRLLERTTRKMRTTDVGQAYYERCQRLLEDFAELDASIKERHREAAGKLRLSVPSEAFTNKHLLPFFIQFAQDYPMIDLEVQLADRYIDIIEEGFDVAIRIGKLQDSSLIARQLAPMKMLICASPNYLAKSSSIKTPDDLRNHQLVIDTNYRGGQQWVFKKDGESISVKANGRLKINSAASTTELILNDLGVGICPSFMVTDELSKGLLTPVLKDWCIYEGGIYAMYTHRKHLSARVSLVVDALKEYFTYTFDQMLLQNQ